MSVLKNAIKKKIGHRACLGYMIGQTYPIYACAGTNHVRHFIFYRDNYLDKHQQNLPAFSTITENLFFNSDSSRFATC